MPGEWDRVDWIRGFHNTTAMSLQPNASHDNRLLCVLLVGGSPFAGKDTFYTTLVRWLEAQTTGGAEKISVIRFAFAEAVKKQYSHHVYPDDPASALQLQKELEDNRVKQDHRLGLIELAMGKREQDPDYWTKITIKDIHQRCVETPLDAPTVAVVTDHQFLGEFWALHNHFWPKQDVPVWKVLINATDEARLARGWIPDYRRDSHVSEDMVRENKVQWHMTVDNSNNGAGMDCQVVMEMILSCLVSSNR